MADAFDDKNDRKDGGKPHVSQGEGTSTFPLHPACHQPHCPSGPAGDPRRPPSPPGNRLSVPDSIPGGRRGEEKQRRCPARTAACNQHPLPCPRRQRSPFLRGRGGEGREGLCLTTHCLSAGCFPRVSSDPLNHGDRVKFHLVPVPDSYLTEDTCCWGSQSLPRHKFRAGLSPGITFAMGWEIFFPSLKYSSE